MRERIVNVSASYMDGRPGCRPLARPGIFWQLSLTGHPEGVGPRGEEEQGASVVPGASAQG